MKKLLIVLLSVMSITFISFAPKRVMKMGDYSGKLYLVELSNEVKDGITDSLNCVYEDSTIRIDWNFRYMYIQFELTNKSNETLKVIWDEAAYISIFDKTSRVFHGGIKYIDKEKSQPPTPIYKKSTMSDLIVPTDNVYYSDGWVEEPIIPAKGTIWSNKVEYIPSLLDKSMRILLPIKIGDKTLEYDFSFKTVFIEEKMK